MCLSVLFWGNLCYSDMLLFLFCVTLFSVPFVNVNILFRLCHDRSSGLLVLWVIISISLCQLFVIKPSLGHVHRVRSLLCHASSWYVTSRLDLKSFCRTPVFCDVLLINNRFVLFFTSLFVIVTICHASICHVRLSSSGVTIHCIVPFIVSL